MRKLTDGLITLVERGETPPGLAVNLKKVLASLENAGEVTSVKMLRKRGTFGSYENVVTINEVVRLSNKQDVVDKLTRVINARSKRTRQESAIDAIQFFDALERRALYHYNHPPLSRDASLHR